MGQEAEKPVYSLDFNVDVVAKARNKMDSRERM